MSVDRDYSIKVNLTANTAGAEQAEQSLKKVGGASELAGKQGEKSAEGMFDKHEGLHHLLHAIGDDAVPGMGRSFAMLAMGPLGAVTAMAMAVEFVKRQVEQTREQLDALAASSAKAFGGGDAITNYVAAAAQAAIETENLREAMEKAADAGDAVKNRYDAEAKAIQAAVDALKQKLKLEQEAEIEAARKSGASAEVVSAMEEQARARSESQSAAAQEAADQAMQVARQRELYERQKNDPALQQAAEGAVTPAKVNQSRTARASELAAQEQALAKATSELNTTANDSLNEQIEGMKHGLENMTRTGARAYLIKAREAEIAELESQTAESRKANAEDRIKELSKEVQNDTVNTAKEKAALEKTTGAATQNTQRIVELQKEINEANTAAKIKAESAAELIRNLAGYGNVKTFERAAGVDTSAGMEAFLNKFAAAQSRLQSHHGTQEDQQTIALMNLILEQTRSADQKTHSVLNSILEAMARDKENHKRTIHDILLRIERAHA